MTWGFVALTLLLIAVCFAFVFGSRWMADRYCPSLTKNTPPTGWDYDGL